MTKNGKYQEEKSHMRRVVYGSGEEGASVSDQDCKVSEFRVSKYLHLNPLKHLIIFPPNHPKIKK